MLAARSSTTVVVLALLLAFATTGFGPGVAFAAVPSVADDGDSSLALDADAYRATRGSLVPLTVTLDEGDQVALTVSGPADSYESTAVFTDTDGDGTVSVAFDSFHAGRGDERRAYRVSGDDRLGTVTRATARLDTPLPAGRYQIVATTGVEWDGARLRLDPFSLGTANVSTLPRDAFDGDGDGDADLSALAEQSTPTTELARGDWLVLQFEAPGASGLLTDPQPAANLVAADPSTPGMRSTHTVRVPISEPGALSKLTVDYDGTLADRPRQLTSGSAVTFVGVDHDADGFVDEALDDHLVSVVSHSNGEYRLLFDGEHDLLAGDVLVVAYDLVNPKIDHVDALSVRVNGGAPTSGTIAYGLAGSGSLGNGLSLDIVATGDDTAGVPVSLAGAHTYADPDTGVLSVVVPTTGLVADAPVDYRATLSVTDDSPYAADVRGDPPSVTFTAVPRTAAIDGAETGDGPFVEQARETVTGTTSLAPGSRIAVSASRFDDPGSFIQVRLATVADDGTWSVTFDFREAAVGSTVKLAVYDWERGQPVPSAALTREPVEVTVVARE